MTMDAQATTAVGGAIAVFAKCPIAGASKTRLAPLLGQEGAASLAKAMLSDILVSLGECPLLKDTLKVLVYAPGTESGEAHMISILQSLHLSYCNMDNVDATKVQQSVGVNAPTGEITDAILESNKWVLLPMKSSAHPKNMPSSNNESISDLTSSSLGDKLEDALERTRKLIDRMKPSATNSNNKSVLFLGMDSPELPMEEVVYGLQMSSGNDKLLQRNEHTPTKEKEIETIYNGKAHMCPANDGGYGLLSVPSHAPSSKIFSGVSWSNSLTAVSQLKALTDAKVDVSIGRLMYDVDEPSDVNDLAMRLIRLRGNENKNSSSEGQKSHDSLTNLSIGICNTVSTGVGKSYPHHTWKALVDLNVIQVCDGQHSVAKSVQKHS